MPQPHYPSKQEQGHGADPLQAPPATRGCFGVKNRLQISVSEGGGREQGAVYQGQGFPCDTEMSQIRDGHSRAHPLLHLCRGSTPGNIFLCATESLWMLGMTHVPATFRCFTTSSFAKVALGPQNYPNVAFQKGWPKQHPKKPERAGGDGQHPGHRSFMLARKMGLSRGARS